MSCVLETHIAIFVEVEVSLAHDNPTRMPMSELLTFPRFVLISVYSFPQPSRPIRNSVTRAKVVYKP